MLEGGEENDMQIWMHRRRKHLPQEKDQHPKTLMRQLKIKQQLRENLQQSQAKEKVKMKCLDQMQMLELEP